MLLFKIPLKSKKMLEQFQFPFAPEVPQKKGNANILMLVIVLAGAAALGIYTYTKRNDTINPKKI